jgi:hypothetical protein
MTTQYGCPSCGGPLTGAATCPACGLPLHGPVAARLWTVDQQLASLGAERERLLTQLRAGDVGQVGAEVPQLMRPAPAPRPHHETSPERVQNTLLTLGAVLLALAGVVFTAVTYRQLGVAGRAAVLLALTAAAGLAPMALRRRGLTASAEAVGGVALALAVLDAVSLRRAGVGDELDSRTYWLVATAVLAVLAGGYARLVALQVARVASVVLAQAPVPLLLARLEVHGWTAGVVLSCQAAVNLLLAAGTPWSRTYRVTALVAAGPLTLAALGASMAAVGSDDRAGSLGLTAVAGVLALACGLAKDRVLQTVAALPVVPLLGGASVAALRPDITADQRPLALVAVTLLALQVAALLPQVRRTGPVLSALALSAIAVLGEADAVVEAVVGPLTWIADPWSRSADTARAALGPDLAWSGTVVTLVVLAGTAVAAVVAGALLDRLAPALPAAGVLVVLAAAALPLGFATSYRDALVLLLVTAGVLGGATLLVPRLVGLALAGSGTAIALLACAWSLADEDATLAVLPVAAALVAGLAVRLPGVLTGLALLLAGGEVAAVAVAQDLAQDQVGAWLLVAAAVPVALSFVLRGWHRLGAEGAATLLAAVAVLLTTTDAGWLSWTLAGAGLLALAVAVRPDRREVGLLGALLLSAASWVRLAEAHVVSPEPYVAPVALVALGLGVLRRRSHPTLDTLSAYGPGLSFALVPSLVRSFVDETPTRGVLLVVVCVSLVLVGARTRTRAGLVVGTVVAVVEGIQLTAPYAAALPRWLPLALLGLLLVVLGATYEQRLRDLQRIRERYERLT